MPDITYDVGRVSFVMKGAWNLATAYEKLDAVTHDGSLYIAKQDVPGGTAITNTTYWQLAAEKGDKGDTGGVDSVNGQQGDIWFPDSRQLISDGYTTDTEPYLTKVNDSDSDRFELAKKLGNTVGLNQQAYPLNSTAWRANNSTASFADGVASFTATARYGGIIPSVNQYRPSIVNGHKYLFIGSIQKTTATAEVGFSVNVGSTAYLNTTDGTGWQTLAAIYTASTTGLGQITCQDNTVSDWTENKTKNIWLIDLTLWFGSDDRIPADLLAHPENWGDYFAGSLDYEPGRLESADGTYILSKDAYSEIIDSVDTGSEGLHGDGTEANSDVKLPNGEITRKIKRDTWAAVSVANESYYSGVTGVPCFRFSKPADGAADGSYTSSGIWSNLVVFHDFVSASDTDYIFGNGTPNRYIYVSHSGVTLAQATTFIQSLQVEYLLATPTTEQGTAFTPIVATVKNGVLSWTNTKGIPVGQESHWFENLRKRVEDRLPDPPSGDGTYRLTCTISGGVKTYSWEA